MEKKTELNGKFFVVKKDNVLTIKYSFLSTVAYKVAEFNSKLEAEDYVKNNSQKP